MRGLHVLVCGVALALPALIGCSDVVVDGSGGNGGGGGGASGTGGVGGEGGTGGLGVGGGGGGLPAERAIPGIAFVDTSTNEVKLATKLADDWTFETIEAFSQAASYVTLAFDSGGTPHLTYQDPISKVLKYATRTGSTWITQVVDSNGETGAWAFLAVDSEDRPHIAYVRTDTNELLYAMRNGSTWSSEKAADAVGTSLFSIGLFIDDFGAAHISYLDSGTARDVRYARKQASWSSERVATFATTGLESRTSLVVDASGTPHITVYDLGAGLHHLEKTGGAWVDTVVAPGTMATGQYPSLHLDSNDELACGYADFGAGSAKLALQVGESWTLETADDDIERWVVSLSMDLDPDDDPYLSYYDQNDSLLKMAVKSDGVWTVETVGGGIAVASPWIAVRAER